MSFVLPGWVEPILQVYGIPWPDVDEDAFHSIKQPLKDFGKDLVVVSNAIENAVNDLESGNPSQTLTAIKKHCAAVRRDFLDPVQMVCDDLAGTPCDLLYNAIVAVKVTLLGLLTLEVGDDVIDIAATVITGGADAELTIAEAAAVREAVRTAAQEGEAEVVSLLQGLADSCLDKFVSSLVNPFINSVESTVETKVDSYMPRFVLGEMIAALELNEGVAQRLHMSPDALNSAVSALWQSSNSLYNAAKALEAQIDKIFDQPDPHAPNIPSLSQDMRKALQSIMQTVRSDLVGGIETLVQHVEQHFVNLLEDFARFLRELDEDAHRVAAAQVMAGVPNVAVQSAASTWNPASELVDPTSGSFDAAEADGVHVGQAGNAAFAAEVDAKVTARAVPVTGTASTVIDPGVGQTAVEAGLHGPAIADAERGIDRVETLPLNPAQPGQGLPPVATAQSPDAPVQGVGPNHGDAHTPHVVPVTETSSDQAQHLHTRSEDHRPGVSTVGTEGSTAEHKVKDVDARVDEVDTVEA